MDQRLYDLLRQCTVHVSVPGNLGHGTGFFVAPGLILTCAHVVKAAQPGTPSVEIHWNAQSHPAHMLLPLPAPDLALLQVSLTDHPCVYLKEEAVPFDDLYSYGYPDTHPDGDPATFSLEGKAGEQGEQLKFKMGQVRPGLSGAPLLNVRTGHVCGVVQLTRDKHNDLGGRAIPTTTVLQAFPELPAQQQQFHQHDRRWLSCIWEFAARTRYLEGMIRRYSSLTLPIGPAEGFSLQAIFQPLALRHDPLQAELQELKRRQALLGEPERASEPAAPVVAENGEDALKRTPKRRCVVLGGPGTGKTTTLKYFTEDRAQQALADVTAPVPLFILLPHLARSGKTLLRYLVDFVEDMGIESRYADMLWQEIESGKAFICMDGLDEVDPQHRPRMLELINDWASRIGNTWIIGSRFTEYKGGQFKRAQFAEWELLPMDHALRVELGQRLFPELQRLLSPVQHIQHSPPPSAEVFVDVLELHPQASTWGSNPLLFSLAAVVFTQTRGLPASRAVLYRDVIGAVIETREPHSLQRRLLLRQLTEFASWLHQTKGRTFSSDELITFFIDRQRKQEDEAVGLANRIVSSGMIDVVGRETYSFRHQSFQEYLTASELARCLTSQDAALREETWNVVWSKRTYSRWTEILRLMTGILLQADSIGKSQALRWLQSLLQQRESEEGDPGNLGLMLALRGLVEVAELPEWHNPQTARLGEQIVSTCIKEVLPYVPSSTRGHIPEQLESVAREMSNLSGALSKMVIEQCLNLLPGPDNDARKVATVILQKQRERVPIEPLLSSLENERAEIREAALDVLAEQGERVPLEPLLDAVHDASRFVREAAAQALIKQGLRVPLESLLQLLSDRRYRLPYDLAKVFTMYGEHLPLEPFLDYLIEADDDELSSMSDMFVLARDVVIDQEARVPLAFWLKVIRRANPMTDRQIDFPLRAQKELIPVDVLFDLLQDENEWVRLVAAEGLGEREPPMPIAKLLPMLKHEDPRVRLTILEALSKRWQQVPEEPLWDVLDDDTSSMIVGAAITVLGNRLSQEGIASLLESEFEAMRIGALKALIAHGPDANIEPVLSVLRDQSSQVRQQAVKTIGALGAQGVSVPSEWLRAIVSDPDVMVLAAAEDTLEAIGAYLPLDVLLECLHEGTPGLANRVANVLRVQSERIAAQTLLDAMQHDDPGIRCAAVFILGTQDTQESVELVLAALQDRHACVRHSVVEVLGRQKRLPDGALLTALHDENTGVRRSGAHVLQALGSQAPLAGVLAALDDVNKEICLIAAHMCVRHTLSVPTDTLMRVVQNADNDLLFLAREQLLLTLVEALALSQSEDTEDLLYRLLRHHREDSVRHAAARALHKRWRPLSWDKLAHLLALLHNEEAQERLAAIELLGVCGEEDDIPIPLEVFITAIQEDEDEKVSLAALRALLAQGQRVPMYIYHDLLQSKDSYMRVMALKALAMQGARLPLSSLLDALHSNEPFVIYEAAQVLEMQGTRLPTDFLLEALQEGGEEISRAVVKVLIAHKDRAHVPSLLALLRNGKFGVPISVIEVLTAYGEPMPVELLLKALYDRVAFFIEKEAYHIIAQALIAQGERVPIGSLLPGLYKQNRHIRRTILEVLRGLKKSVPLEILLLAVSDEDAGQDNQAAVLRYSQMLGTGQRHTSLPVVGHAAHILSTQYPEMMQPLVAEATAILRGQSQGTFLASITQCFVASLIADLGSPTPEFLATLTELLRWPHWLVRLNAIYALGRLRRNVPDAVIKRLLQFRRDPDPMMAALREAADHALAEILSLETGIEDD